MCCLKYEEDHYEETRKRMPRVGKEVITPDGNGIVVELNILKETVRVRIPKGDGTEQKDYPLEDVKRLHQGSFTPKEGGQDDTDPSVSAEDADEADNIDDIQENDIPEDMNDYQN